MHLVTDTAVSLQASRRSSISTSMGRGTLVVCGVSVADCESWIGEDRLVVPCAYDLRLVVLRKTRHSQHISMSFGNDATWSGRAFAEIERFEYLRIPNRGAYIQIDRVDKAPRQAEKILPRFTCDHRDLSKTMRVAAIQFEIHHKQFVLPEATKTRGFRLYCVSAKTSKSILEKHELERTKKSKLTSCLSRSFTMFHFLAVKMRENLQGFQGSGF